MSIPLPILGSILLLVLRVYSDMVEWRLAAVRVLGINRGVPTVVQPYLPGTWNANDGVID